MAHWLDVLGIVAPLMSAVAVAVWRRNDAALASALRELAEVRAEAMETRFEAIERRSEEHYMDSVARFERADEKSSKLTSMVQALADLRPRVEALERGRR